MILFKSVFEKIEVERVPVSWDFEHLSLIGHLPPASDKLVLNVIGAAVSIERGFSNLIYAEVRGDNNWRVCEQGFTQTKLGRGRIGMEIDGGFCGSGSRPECAKIYLPYNFRGDIDITICGASRLYIDFASARNFNLRAYEQAAVQIGNLHCTESAKLRSSDDSTIQANLLTARAFDIDADRGIVINSALVTPGALDVEGCPMEIRYPDEPRYRYLAPGN